MAATDPYLDEDEYVVDFGCSMQGLRRLHLLRPRPISTEKWCRVIEGIGGVVVDWLAYEEPGTGMWHLRIYWRMTNGDDGRRTTDDGKGQAVAL